MCLVCVSLVCGVVCVMRHAEKTWKKTCVDLDTPLRVCIQNVPVCTSKTSTCFEHLDVLPVHTETFRMHTRRRVGICTLGA